MKTRAFLILPLLLSLLAFGCNKPSSYTIRVQNVSAETIRVRVELLQAYAAPGQNPLKLDKAVLQGQYLEIYHNEGVGISLPLQDDNDSLLKYKVLVFTAADSTPVNRNMSNIEWYYKTENKKAKSYLYEYKITPQDFVF